MSGAEGALAEGGAAAVVGGGRLGAFELVREIARGGMGVVYEAWDADLQRTVAIKLLLEGAEPEVVRRFQREALASARLRHPGIIEVHRAGTERIDGVAVPYLVMAFVPGGRTFEDLPEEMPLSVRVERLAQVCEAVGAAHRAGIVHRDLKPANVLLTPDDEPVVTDFGWRWWRARARV